MCVCGGEFPVFLRGGGSWWGTPPNPKPEAVASISTLQDRSPEGLFDDYVLIICLDILLCTLISVHT